MVRRQLILPPFGCKVLPPAICYGAHAVSVNYPEGMQLHAELSCLDELPSAQVPGGAVLFDRLIHVPGYYLLKAEDAIIEINKSHLRGVIENCCWVDFGPGVGTKTLEMFQRIGAVPRHYVGVDIAAEHLVATRRKLSRVMPLNHMDMIEADFLSRRFWELQTLRSIKNQGVPVIGVMNGSTLFNFSAQEQDDFLFLGRRVLNEMLIGADCTQDEDLLEGAYGQPVANVALQFYLNGLICAGRLTQFDITIPHLRKKFDYGMKFNRQTNAAEIKITSKVRQTYSTALSNGEALFLSAARMDSIRASAPCLVFEEGEPIHCISSGKNDLDTLYRQFRKAGWGIFQNMSFSEAMLNSEVFARLPFNRYSLNHKVDYNLIHLY
jgi:uncharacterized SAM-dependent methyltransferase